MNNLTVSDARRIAATRFVYTFLLTSKAYGRKTYMDFRIQLAREKYLQVRRDEVMGVLFRDRGAQLRARFMSRWAWSCLP